VLASVAEAAYVRAHVRRFLAERQAETAALRAAQAIEADIQPSALLEWAERYRRIDGQSFSLDRFAPLRAIYADDHPRIVVTKPSQRGVSEWAINYAIFALDRGAEVWANGQKTGLNVGYLFPTQAALSAFSKERISGLKRESAYLEALLGDSDDYDTVDFKQIRDSYLYLRGGWSEAGLLSFAADVAIFDEYDRMEPSAIALARRRLNASTVRREVFISTPTLPGTGVHGLYLQSDRQVYEQWHSCGGWVSYDFWRDVKVDGVLYEIPGGRGWRTWPAELIRASEVRLHCPACQVPISEDERCAPGRWRAEAPEVQGLRGYHIPWWPFPVVDLVEYAVTAVSQDPSELTELYRSDLGLPYESSGSRITREMLAALSHDLPGGMLPDQKYRATTMGLDVGNRFHYRVSSIGEDGGRYVRAAGSVATWTEVDMLMVHHGVRLCVVDAYPEEHGARAFVARHAGKAVTATYPTANALKGVLCAPDPAKALEAGRVQINRTMAMDAVYSAIATASERWPSAIHNDPEVVTHLTAPVRVETLDPHGQSRADWVHTKPDHIFHASVYDRIARELLAGQRTTPGTLAMGSARDSRIR
jgi:Arc/MetJ-type ribon-helix-helix transcriptional regulator